MIIKSYSQASSKTFFFPVFGFIIRHVVVLRQQSNTRTREFYRKCRRDEINFYKRTHGFRPSFLYTNEYTRVTPVKWTFVSRTHTRIAHLTTRTRFTVLRSLTSISSYVLQTCPLPSVCAVIKTFNGQLICLLLLLNYLQYV